MHTSVVGFRKERTDRRSTLLLGAVGTYRGKQLSIMTPLLGYGERQTIFLQNKADILLHADTSNIYMISVCVVPKRGSLIVTNRTRR